MKKTKRPKQMTAFNTNYILYIISSVLSLAANVYYYRLEKTVIWILILWLAASLVIMLADALYYVFTKEELIFVYIWGHKTRVPWDRVTGVEKRGFWESYKDLPKYMLYYDRLYKNRMIRQWAGLPLTPKIQKCMKMYCPRQSIGETKNKKG